MADLIGVVGAAHLLSPSYLKRTALLFDRMAIPQLTESTLDYWLTTQPVECNNLIWLLDQGLVFQAGVPKTGDDIDQDTENEIRSSIEGLQNSLSGFFGDEHWENSREYLTANS